MSKVVDDHPYLTGVVALVVLVVGLSTILGSPKNVASQSTGVAITGFAWSDNIGWIDLNCTNSGVCGTDHFGLSVNSSGVLSGYAWSDNIGWVSANASDLTGCPNGPCTATITGGVLSGWLKAISADNNGWDGWISLSGSNYGLTLASGSFSGYAWGSTNVGWVDFEYAKTAYGTCTPSYPCSGNTIEYTSSSCSTSAVTTCVSPEYCQSGASACVVPVITFNSSGNFTGNLQLVPSIVRTGEVTQVHWNVSNAQSCTVQGTNGDSWTGLSSPTNGETSSPITAQTTYSLSCQAYAGNPNVDESMTVELTPRYEEL